jgi:hypothetical protein
MRLLQDSHQPFRRPFIRIPPAWNDNRIGRQQAIQALRGCNHDAARSREGSCLQCTGFKVIPAFQFRSWKAEELYGNTKLECAKAIVGQNGYPMRQRQL